MGFLTDLQLRSYGQRYQVLTPLIFDFDGDYYVVPVGFETDLASVPWFMRWLIAPDASYIRSASVLHDYLYSLKSTEYHVPRREADRIFYFAMRSKGATRTFALMAYTAVRVFGGPLYKKST